MTNRFFVAIFVVVASLVFLVYTAIGNTAKAVVTVNDLLKEKVPVPNIRLGARVSESDIEYQTKPGFFLRFLVHDIVAAGESLPVVYRNMKPDTLKAGRDVILEGDFNGKEFHAKQLLTQCPSKYEVPTPGEKNKETAY